MSRFTNQSGDGTTVGLKNLGERRCSGARDNQAYFSITGCPQAGCNGSTPVGFSLFTLYPTPLGPAKAHLLGPWPSNADGTRAVLSS